MTCIRSLDSDIVTAAAQEQCPGPPGPRPFARSDANMLIGSPEQ